MKNQKFTSLPQWQAFSIPKEFEYPHFYVPTAIAQAAAKDLQQRLKKHLPELERKAKGRMMGVLVVESTEGEIGYLSAYSGELQTELEMLPFVPPVHQLPKGEDFPQMAEINAISKEIKALENSDAFAKLKKQLEQVRVKTAANIKAKKAAAKKAKAKRHNLRKEALKLAEHERISLLEALDKHGAQEGMDLRRYTRSENLRLEKAQSNYARFQKKINKLKAMRKAKSAQLQDSIFASFIFLNSQGERKNVKNVFNDAGIEVPPAGAGECAAPKLFQYAFLQGMKPIALAEFWWGASPNSEIREHGNFYAACRGKCQPILAHMLKGIPVKPNPLHENFGANKPLETLYEDEHLVVVNKPEGLLSIPGRKIEDSVKTRMQKRYPEVTSPMIVHRLDQDTSGIMIIALTKEAHKLLQQQFLERSIRKTYVAILEKNIDESEGKIELPLLLDYYNRPMQKVDFENGKPAITHFEVIEKTENKTLIKLKPVTGRSHQLRVHCAHKLGLHAPIFGDNLYGKAEKRLYLHAEEIEFLHPITNEMLRVKAERPFGV